MTAITSRGSLDLLCKGALAIRVNLGLSRSCAGELWDQRSKICGVSDRDVKCLQLFLDIFCIWFLGMFVKFFIWRCLHLHLHSKMFHLRMSVFAFISVLHFCLFHCTAESRWEWQPFNWQPPILFMLRAVILFMLRVWELLFYLCWKPSRNCEAVYLLYAESRIGAEAALFIPGSSKRVQLSLSAFSRSWTLLDSLNCFGILVHVFGFSGFPGTVLGSSAWVDLFGRPASVVPACLFVSCWTSVY